jgi:hypothetical protein
MKNFIDQLTLRQPLYNEDDGSGGGGNDNGSDDEGKGADADKRTVTMTQAELDALIKREKGRVAKKYGDYDDLRAKVSELEKLEEERRLAALSETERLKAEKEAADKKAQELEATTKQAQEAANKRVIDAEIRSIARTLNANDASDVLSFVDKSQISIDDEGNVKGAEEAVKAVKETKPYLFKAAATGADAGGGSNGARNHDPNAGSAKRLAELAEIARKTGRTEDKVAYVTYKRELESKK